VHTSIGGACGKGGEDGRVLHDGDGDGADDVVVEEMDDGWWMDEEEEKEMSLTLSELPRGRRRLDDGEGGLGHGIRV
jgi:hypothetical protein